MADPTPYERTYSFTDYQAGNPSAPLPGIQVDNELENVEQALGGAIDAIKDVRRSDGALKNGIVSLDSLSPAVAAGIGTGALASAEAAAASADAASDSAVAAAASATAADGSATAASGYASNALTSRNEAEAEKILAQTARTGAQTARDFAAQWASAAEGVDVDDGVNTPDKSAYHYAQVALGAATGALPDGSVSSTKIVDEAVTRAKLASAVTDELDGKAEAAATTSALAGKAGLASVNTFTKTQKWSKGADVASAAALTLGDDGNYFDVTGTTAITSIATVGVGTVIKLHFDGALTLTHHSTDLVLLGGANITTAAGDEAEFVEYDTGKWRCVNYQRASGKALNPAAIQSGAIVATTSGTAIDLTGIPAEVKRVTIELLDVSTSGTSIVLVQLGTSAGIQTSGYVGQFIVNSSPGTSNTSGFSLLSGASNALRSGSIVLTRANPSSDTWVLSGSLFDRQNTAFQGVSGYKTLSAALDRIRLVAANGTDTFDGGSLIVHWEF